MSSARCRQAGNQPKGLCLLTPLPQSMPCITGPPCCRPRTGLLVLLAGLPAALVALVDGSPLTEMATQAAVSEQQGRWVPEQAVDEATVAHSPLPVVYQAPSPRAVPCHHVVWRLPSEVPTGPWELAPQPLKA